MQLTPENATNVEVNDVKRIELKKNIKKEKNRNMGVYAYILSISKMTILSFLKITFKLFF